ncbi:MAG: M23 family metallopeptidase [Rhodothermales bacterium]
MLLLHRLAAWLGLFSLLAAACSTYGAPDRPRDPEEGPIARACPGGVYEDWETSDYVLPYPVGRTYLVDLSHCSGSYHSEGLPDEYAIDFNMPIGTLITASRAGTVVHVVESGYDGNDPNNLVVVSHGDGTYAEYMHLTRDGALVEVGETVAPGDSIGLSGATGLAGYPHLHFVVAVDDWKWPYESTPTTFSNTAPNPRSLASGYEYTARAY